MNKTLLVAGGAHSDVPTIQAAKRLGFRVYTSGNVPDSYGHACGDGAHLADFSDPEALLALATRLEVDAICPSANDFSMISCAFVAERLGLPGYDSHEMTLRLHHKDAFRVMGAELGLSCPRFIALTSPNLAAIECSGLRFPLIVKPIDLTGGKGIERVDDAIQLSSALQAAFAVSRAKRVVVEEFFDGTLHSHSCVLVGGRIVFAFADNEYSYLNPYTVSTSSHPCFAQRVLGRLCAETERLASSLGLADGILHCQFLANGEDFRIVEYTRRMPGDFYAVPVEATTGVDYAGLYVRPYLGLPIDTAALSAKASQRHRFFSRHFLLAARRGYFAGVDIAPEMASNIVGEAAVREPGHFIENPLAERQGVFFLAYESLEEMLEKTAAINSLIRVRVSDSHG